MSVNTQLVAELLDDLHVGEDAKQARACLHIRDLCQHSLSYCAAFVSGGAICPLVGLLDDCRRQQCLLAAQALAALAGQKEWRASIREAGGLDNMMELLRQDKAVSEAALESVVRTLQHFAQDVDHREELLNKGAGQVCVKLLSSEHSEDLALGALELLQHLAWDRKRQDVIRSAGALRQVVWRLGDSEHPCSRNMAGALMNCLVVLVVANVEAQEEVRTLGGLTAILKQLQVSPYDETTGAAADVLRAVCQSNEANKGAVRREWGLPLLVLLLGPNVSPHICERSVDCLRILTSNNEDNKVALMACQSALPSLCRLIGEECSLVCNQRAAAVIANLSTCSEYFATFRNCGVLQRLVRLLEKGNDKQLVEMVTQALGNLLRDEHNRTAIRLSGGIPPLLQLMLETSDRQVQQMAETALERLRVTDLERNAILAAFRFCEYRHNQQMADLLNVGSRAPVSDTHTVLPEEIPGRESAAVGPVIGPKPFAKYGPEELCILLSQLALPEEVQVILKAAGLTGGDLLELQVSDAIQDLGWTKLQAKKLTTIQKAYDLFCSMSQTPGAGEVPLLEVQKFLERLNLPSHHVLAIVDGLRDSLPSRDSAAISFQHFVLNYQWLVHTLESLTRRRTPDLFVSAMVAVRSELSTAASADSRAGTAITAADLARQISCRPSIEGDGKVDGLTVGSEDGVVGVENGVVVAVLTADDVAEEDRENLAVKGEIAAFVEGLGGSDEVVGGVCVATGEPKVNDVEDVREDVGAEESVEEEKGAAVVGVVKVMVGNESSGGMVEGNGVEVEANGVAEGAPLFEGLSVEGDVEVEGDGGKAGSGGCVREVPCEIQVAEP